ncbi:acylglycerol kinase, mitochondrial isoform X1 [Pangasianodon hypophthalmus]|uniref:acylglycerol kinase, mitochondrial isoform X1 n=1 Tax=Pangasianodon hypophthalmus TaxID=310915 RepID=UPI000EFFC8B5|nr:acylglycerol kinase, mitochondrial isoform X1 [Pangasianodon hypophthalmus]
MARVVKVLRTLRNHWKKSTFAVCVLSYGGHWLYGKHCDNVLRREACQEARKFGQKLVGPQESLQKATVILNPAACKGKANNLFEKNAAPILHLAGIEVKVIKTDYEGQAKKLMDLMEQTDMLIVAGGDGTLQEVITGLLRRPDEEAFSKTPIGFIPLGSQNSLSQSLHIVTDDKVKCITSATLSILKGETVPLDVLQIKSEKEQPVFALLSLRWGSFRDVATSISKYWYLGPLKTRAAHWFSTLREWPQMHHASVSYLPPIPRPPDLPDVKPVRPSLLYRIYRRLKNYWTPPPEEPQVEAEPERWEDKQISTMELTISTQNRNPVKRRTDDSLVLSVEPDTLTVGQFITEGIKKAENPLECTEKALQIEASVCRLSLPQEGAGFFDVDNEEFEAMPVEVKLLPRKLRFFCSSERRDQLAQMN